MMKGLMALFVFGLFLAGRADTAWPVVTWPMYSGYGEAPPGDEAASWQLYALDRTGKVFRFWEQDIYGELPSGDGKRVMDLTFAATGSKRREAMKTLLGRIRSLLPGVDVAQVQYWRLIWRHVDGNQSPPFDASHPDERQLLGGFDVTELADQP